MNALLQRAHNRTQRSHLQTRMTISYVLVTVASVLLIEILVLMTIFIILIFTPALQSAVKIGAQRTAQLYAQIAGLQAQGNALNPQTTFMANQPASMAVPLAVENNGDGVPYINTPVSNPQTVAFALLIAPNGSALASSAPMLYPAQQPVAQLLPDKYQLIAQALQGKGGSAAARVATGQSGWAAEPVWSRQHQVIGAVYVQVPPVVSATSYIRGLGGTLLVSGLLLLVITVPIGGLFGFLTTHPIVHRVQRLVDATTQFARGNYAQRVSVGNTDEIGQLERQFNQMAEQLVENIELRQQLYERNARLAERSRIARDLHDSVKQQVFALSMQISTALAFLERQPETARTHLMEADTLAYQAQQELTALIRELRPSALREQGLPAALREYATDWSRQHDIPVELAITGGCILPLTLEEALLRIVQEALSNSARHSQASMVKVHFSCEQGQAQLVIEDNGRGFDYAGKTGRGVGLYSMHERIEACHGTLTIESQPGQGTRIVASCPYTSIEEKGVVQ